MLPECERLRTGSISITQTERRAVRAGHRFPGTPQGLRTLPRQGPPASQSDSRVMVRLGTCEQRNVGVPTAIAREALRRTGPNHSRVACRVVLALSA
jgi:hypothetical protein